ncbi:Hypothetical protein NTJ_10097 [Nesidiocoris tenuis]|uniref:Uncharacterized protein n=1 Tax=Nesidiocoris tenuis TaxID=355587 RepID=A0ABN7AZ55_9HEMI|nr:Hypothetical protein NTJ_10097 [Nesidiocoris tenuis]
MSHRSSTYRKISADQFIDPPYFSKWEQWLFHFSAPAPKGKTGYSTKVAAILNIDKTGTPSENPLVYEKGLRSTKNIQHLLDFLREGFAMDKSESHVLDWRLKMETLTTVRSG